MLFVFFFKQKTAYEMRISDRSSDVCSSDLLVSKDCPSMSTALRRLFGSTLGKFFALAFVLLVGLAFALGDVTGSGRFGGVGGAKVARVGSREIGLGELRDRVRLVYDQARTEQQSLNLAAFGASGGSHQVLN